MQAPWPSAVLCSSHACVWWRQIFTVTVGRLWTNGCVWKWGMWVYSPQMAYQWNDDGLMINAVLRYPNVISTHTHILEHQPVSQDGEPKKLPWQNVVLFSQRKQKTPHTSWENNFWDKPIVYTLYTIFIYILSFMHDILYTYTYTYTYKYTHTYTYKYTHTYTYTYTYAYIQGLCVYIYIICAMY